MVGTGYAFPIVLALIILGQIYLGQVWLPELRYGRVLPTHWSQLTPQRWQFWCTLAAEAGIALYCLGWYGVANSRRWALLARPLAGLGFLGMTAGVLGLLAQIAVG